VNEPVIPNGSGEETKPDRVPIESAPQVLECTPQTSTEAGDTSLLEAELAEWRLMDKSRRCANLRAAIVGEQTVRLEVLVQECTRAYQGKDRQMLDLAFEALSRSAAPLLLSQARGLPIHERQAQAQQILLDLFEAIRKDKAGFAQIRFAAFAKRRAISLYRQRRARFEGVYDRIYPTAGNTDPLQDIPMRKPSTEALALLEYAQDRLPEKLRRVFIQYHHLGMTHEAIAKQHGVSARSIYTWIKEAEATIGYSGEAHGR
jgi:DNA-directed RNA polymerase specialized sigma24 family protein